MFCEKRILILHIVVRKQWKYEAFMSFVRNRMNRLYYACAFGMVSVVESIKLHKRFATE